MLKYALWADRVTVKQAIGTSPFQLVYGTDAVFPVQLGIPGMNFFQDCQEEPNDMQTLEEISTQNGHFNFNSNSMSSCVSLLYRS